jgi:hypothetical protein
VVLADKKHHFQSRIIGEFFLRVKVGTALCGCFLKVFCKLGPGRRSRCFVRDNMIYIGVLQNMEEKYQGIGAINAKCGLPPPSRAYEYCWKETLLAPGRSLMLDLSGRAIHSGRIRFIRTFSGPI